MRIPPCLEHSFHGLGRATIVSRVDNYVKRALNRKNPPLGRGSGSFLNLPSYLDKLGKEAND